MTELHRKSWLQLRDWQWCLLVALVTLAAFAPGLRYPFMMDWDDAAFVVHNQHLAWTWENLRGYFTQPFLELYTPVPLVSLMLDHALFGLNPLGYHLHSLLLHIACALLLYAILRKLPLDRPLAALGALLWALSPQKVESVIWIAERKDTDCGFFALAAFLAFQCALETQRARRRIALALAAGLLGMLSIWSKPATVALPGIFIVFAFLKAGASGDSGVSGGAGSPSSQAAVHPTAAITCTLCPVPFILLGLAISTHFTQTGAGHLERLWAIPLHNLFWYPLSALWPWRLSPIHVPIRAWSEIWSVVAIGLLLAAVLLALARWRKVPWRTIICAPLLIGGTTIPVLGLLRYTDYTHCDRYNYCLSALMWAIVLPLLARLPWRRAWLLPSALALLAACFFVRTWCYLPYWETTDAFVAYLFQQPGIPNRKSYQVGINACLRSQNTALLAVIRERLRNATPPEGIYSNPPEEAPLQVLDAHLACAAGDLANAFQLYQDIQQRSIALREKYVIPTELTQLMYRDLIHLHQRRGDSAAADFYFRQLENVNEYHRRQQ